jgi:hypothetical protein
MSGFFIPCVGGLPSGAVVFYQKYYVYLPQILMSNYFYYNDLKMHCVLKSKALALMEAASFFLLTILNYLPLCPKLF